MPLPLRGISQPRQGSATRGSVIVSSHHRQKSGIANSERVRFDGNIFRRKAADREFFWGDTELPGFGLWTFLGGAKSWFVQFRQRGKQNRVTLGRPAEMRPEKACTLARAQLAMVALDGLPVSPKAKAKGERSGGMLFAEFAPRFWADYCRHWKPSTRMGSGSRDFKDLLAIYGHLRVEAIRRSDVLRRKLIDRFLSARQFHRLA